MGVSGETEEVSTREFDKISVLGKGSYSCVVLAKHKATGKLCAMKIIQRSLLKKEKKEHEFKAEQEILRATNHPNIIKLLYSFTTRKNYYFGLEYVPNGDLSTLLRVAGPLPTALARHYAGEIVRALEHLHSRHIAHRDLKPENLLLDEDWRVKVTDFGTGRFMDRKSPASEVRRDTNVTFVGTPEYVSPEVLLDTESGTPSDLWALGCIVYKLLAGKAPFVSKSNYLLFEAIINKGVEYPEGMPEKAVDLCEKLLAKEPSKRLGAGAQGSPLGFDALKRHEFFEGIDFEKLEEAKPPIDPELVAKLKEENKKNKIVDNMVSSDEDQSVEGQPAKKAEDDYLKEYVNIDPTMLDEEEQNGKYRVIKRGVVEKKCGWLFFKQRKLVLTNRPRLYYALPSGEYKGDILLTASVKAKKSSGVKFDVAIPQRTYRFEGKDEKDTDDWVSLINDTIDKYCH